MAVVVFTGGRYFDKPEGISAALDLCEVVVKARGAEITSVRHGGQRGADTLFDIEARRRGYPVEVFEADWSKGVRAGPIRNERMMVGADFCLAVTGYLGTQDAIRRAIKHRLILLYFGAEK